jgi:predicted GNAT family N-acyltransferase
MRLEIKATAQLNDDETHALKALSVAVYPPKPGAAKNPSPIKWARPQWRILIRDAEDQLVSHVGVLTRLGAGDDIEFLIGGIGGVMTHPAQRGRGYASAGIQRATDFLRREMGVDFSLLVCRADLMAYYQRLGWSAFAGDTLVRQNSIKSIFTWNEVMVIAAAQALPSCRVLDLCGLPW